MKVKLPCRIGENFTLDGSKTTLVGVCMGLQEPDILECIQNGQLKLVDISKTVANVSLVWGKDTEYGKLFCYKLKNRKLMADYVNEDKCYKHTLRPAEVEYEY